MDRVDKWRYDALQSESRFQIRLAHSIAAIALLGWFGFFTSAVYSLASTETVGFIERKSPQHTQCAPIGEMEFGDCTNVVFVNPATGRPVFYGCDLQCWDVVAFLEPDMLYRVEVLRLPLMNPQIVRVLGPAEPAERRIYWDDY